MESGSLCVEGKHRMTSGPSWVDPGINPSISFRVIDYDQHQESLLHKHFDRRSSSTAAPRHSSVTPFTMALTTTTRRLLLRCSAGRIPATTTPLRPLTAFSQLHTTSTKPATPLPITAHGPPPQAPIAHPNPLTEWRTRHKLAEENVKSRKRFWKNAQVVTTNSVFSVSPRCRHCQVIAMAGG